MAEPLSMSQLLALYGVQGLEKALSSNQAANASTKAAAIQAQAARDAAKINQQSADKALALQTQIYNDQRNQAAPYADYGRAATHTLSKLLGLNVQASPPSNITLPTSSNLPGMPSTSLTDGGGDLADSGGGTGSKIASTALRLAPFALSALVKHGAAAEAGTAATIGSKAIHALGAAAPWLAVAGAGVAITTAWLKSQAHWEANTVVQKLENPFHQQFLAPLSSQFANLQQSGKLDPQTAQQYIATLDQTWQDYQQKANEYGNRGSDERKVSEQSIANLKPTIDKMRADMMAAINNIQPAQPAAAPTAPSPAAPPTATSMAAPPPQTLHPDIEALAQRYRR